eukprot:2394243-Lingulodinium_polyedra.AAC.1
MRAGATGEAALSGRALGDAWPAAEGGRAERRLARQSRVAEIEVAAAVGAARPQLSRPLGGRWQRQDCGAQAC